MGITNLSEAAMGMGHNPHRFTASEKEFIMQFAFKTGDKELTNKLIDELASGKEGKDFIFKKYGTLVGFKPDWICRIENLLVALEMYRLEEEKVITHLMEILEVYHIDVSEEALRGPELETVREQIHREIEAQEEAGDVGGNRAGNPDYQSCL